MDDPSAVDSVTLGDIRAARDVAGAVAKHTPVVSSVVLSNQFGRPVVLKAENLQRTGSFKIRGAMNKLASLGSRARAQRAWSGYLSSYRQPTGKRRALRLRRRVLALARRTDRARLAASDSTRSCATF